MNVASLEEARFLFLQRERQILRAIRDLEKAIHTASRISGNNPSLHLLSAALDQLYAQLP